MNVYPCVSADHEVVERQLGAQQTRRAEQTHPLGQLAEAPAQGLESAPQQAGHSATKHLHPD